jgi:hypothetical protein
MIASYEYFISIGQITKLVDKVEHFLLRSSHSEITRMDDDIGSWQICQLPM